jgi:hypothetical protein
MISSTAKKTGRLIAVYKASNGDRIPGLMKLKDGRWSASGPQKFTFGEPDEKLAMARFRAWGQRKQSPALGTVQYPLNAYEAALDIARRAIAAGGHLAATTTLAGDRYVVSDETLSDQQWQWLRKQTINRPQWVAERVGIEQIGCLRAATGPRRQYTASGGLAGAPIIGRRQGAHVAGRNVKTDDLYAVLGIDRAAGIDQIKHSTPAAHKAMAAVVSAESFHTPRVTLNPPQLWMSARADVETNPTAAKPDASVRAR